MIKEVCLTTAVCRHINGASPAISVLISGMTNDSRRMLLTIVAIAYAWSEFSRFHWTLSCVLYPYRIGIDLVVSFPFFFEPNSTVTLSNRDIIIEGTLYATNISSRLVFDYGGKLCKFCCASSESLINLNYHRPHWKRQPSAMIRRRRGAWWYSI